MTAASSSVYVFYKMTVVCLSAYRFSPDENSRWGWISVWVVTFIGTVRCDHLFCVFDNVDVRQPTSEQRIVKGRLAFVALTCAGQLILLIVRVIRYIQDTYLTSWVYRCSTAFRGLLCLTARCEELRQLLSYLVLLWFSASSSRLCGRLNHSHSDTGMYIVLLFCCFVLNSRAILLLRRFVIWACLSFSSSFFLSFFISR